MKKEKGFILILVIVLLFGGAYKLYDELTKDHTADAAGIGNEIVLAKDIAVYDKEGNEVKLSNYIGKPIVMNFWASWCTPCQIEMPEFEKVYQELGDEVEFLMINMTASGGETVDRAHAFVENATGIPINWNLCASVAARRIVFSSISSSLSPPGEVILRSNVI